MSFRTTHFIRNGNCIKTPKSLMIINATARYLHNTAHGNAWKATCSRTTFFRPRHFIRQILV